MIVRVAKRFDWWVPTALCFSIVLIISSSNYFLSPSISLTDGSASLRLASSFGPDFAGEMVAERAGLFDAQHLHLFLRPGRDATSPIESVVDGTDTFGVTRADRFIAAREQGAPLVAFAPGFLESDAVFIGLKTTGVSTPQSFPHHAVGRRHGDDTASIFDEFITRFKLSADQINQVAVTSDLSMLLAGRVDVWPAHIGQEDYDLTRRGLEYVVIPPASYGIHSTAMVYFATEQTLKEHPLLVEHFLRGLIGGWNMVFNDPNTSVPMIRSFDADRLNSEYLRFVISKQRRYLKPTALRYGRFDDAEWNLVERTFLRARLVERTIDLPESADFHFLRDSPRQIVSAFAE